MRLNKYLALAGISSRRGADRMIGTGRIGGKSLGMLLARAALRKADLQWGERLESHDSFYVGSDVFFTYLVQNGCWWLRRRMKDFNEYLRRAGEARELSLIHI